MNLLLRTLSLTLALGGAQLSHAGAAAAQSACRPIGTILERNPQLSRFHQALRTSGMLVVVNGPAVYTVFAPSDTAFNRIPPEQWQAVLNDQVALTRLLSYHLVKGRLPHEEARVGATPTTLAGVPLVVRPQGQHVVVNNARAQGAVLNACNGLVYVIDTFLLPGDVTPALDAASVTTTRAPSQPGYPNVQDIPALPLNE